MIKLVFISKIPNENAEQNTGGMSRIITVDKYLSFADEIYYIDFKNKKILNRSTNTYTIFNMLNIINIMKSVSFIYVHAFANMARILPFFVFTKAKIIFDAHGIASVEEKSKKKYINYFILQVLEKLSLRKANLLICVTYEMKKYFESLIKKLPKTIVMPIVNETIKTDIEKQTAVNINEINKKDDEQIIMYSGGVQIWQNIDLMIEIANSMENKKIKFLFLSKEKDYLIHKIDAKKFNKQIFVYSTTREQIGYYYEISDYGFLLRQEDLINRVAFPTKLFEYIDYQVIPVVLNEDIGDFKKIGLKGIYLNDIENTADIEITKKIKENNSQKIIEINNLFNKNKSELINFIQKG